MSHVIFDEQEARTLDIRKAFHELRASGVFEDELKPRHPLDVKPSHQLMIMLSSLGHKNNEIAELLDVTRETVSVVLNTPEIKHIKHELARKHVQELTQDVRSYIQGHSLEAFDTVVGLMRGAESENVRMKSAFDILDRAGFKPKDQNVNLNLNMRPEEAALIAETLRETSQPVEDLPAVEQTWDAVSRGNHAPDRLPTPVDSTGDDRES